MASKTSNTFTVSIIALIALVAVVAAVGVIIGNPSGWQAPAQDQNIYGSAVAGCRDTDGDDPFTRGLVSDVNGKKRWDRCSAEIGGTEGTVTERLCRADGKLQNVERPCPGLCENGACLSCKDTDGDDPYIRGLVSDVMGKARWDRCSADIGKSGTGVTERLCDADGKLQNVDRECAYGCLDGACREFFYCEPQGEIFDNGLSRACFKDAKYGNYEVTDECYTSGNFMNNRWEIGLTTERTYGGSTCPPPPVNSPDGNAFFTYDYSGGDLSVTMMQDFLDRPHSCSKGYWNWFVMALKSDARDPPLPTPDKLVTRHTLTIHNEGVYGSTKNLVRTEGYVYSGNVKKKYALVLSLNCDKCGDKWPNDPAAESGCNPDDIATCASYVTLFDASYFGYHLPLDETTTLVVDWEPVYDYAVEHGYIPEHDRVTTSKIGAGFEIRNDAIVNSRKSTFRIDDFQVFTKECS